MNQTRLSWTDLENLRGLKWLCFTPMRGQPEIYDELKKIVSFCITPTAQLGLAQLSQQLNISRSELIEQIGRGLLTIAELKTESD